MLTIVIGGRSIETGIIETAIMPHESDQILADPDLAGVHFTGSTTIFDRILHKIANTRYRNYPRVVGETSGKNFTLAHASADAATLTTAIIRGGYEYQGRNARRPPASTSPERFLRMSETGW